MTHTKIINIYVNDDKCSIKDIDKFIKSRGYFDWSNLSVYTFNRDNIFNLTFSTTYWNN